MAPAEADCILLILCITAYIVRAAVERCVVFKVAGLALRTRAAKELVLSIASSVAHPLAG